jgi:hypothetical protein
MFVYTEEEIISQIQAVVRLTHICRNKYQEAGFRADVKFSIR